MNYFDKILGNDEAKSLFSQCIKENKLSHAYMLAGPAGCGKKTFAKCIAQELARRDVSDEELISKIESENSPDIFLLTTEEKRIGIDTVRSFVSTIYLTPNELEFKMYIFDAADRMTPQAQNALLKIIEEPPQKVYIMLLCENPSSILQTVRSRVIRVNMQTFSSDEIREYLRQSADETAHSAPEKKLDFAVKMSRGALGAAESLLNTENKAFDAFTKANEVISSLAKKNRSVSYFDFVSLILLFADNSDKLAMLLDYLAFLLRDIMTVQNSEYQKPVTLGENEAERYASAFSVSSVISALEVVTEVKKNMAFNSNLGLACAYLAENLWRRI